MRARAGRLLAGMLLLVAGWIAPRADAADPWGRPAHLRAVSAPPQRWTDLWRDRRPVRLWWDRVGEDLVGDPACSRGDVQVERRGRWRTVARGVSPGFTSRPVRPGTRFRVRLEVRAGPGAGDCPERTGRWSAPVAAPPVTTPTDIARLWAPSGALLGERVGQVRVQPSTGRVWATTLGGGAAELDPGTGEVRPWTRFEGLPDDRVIDVDVGDDRVLLGTAGGGLLLVEEGREGPAAAAPVRGMQPARTWSTELPSIWVQAVALGGDGAVAWLGTDAGLAVATGDRVATAWAPGSVFSLTPSAGGGLWVGAEGLRHLAGDPADPGGFEVTPTPLPAEDHVYGLVEDGDGLRVATLEEGVVRLEPTGDTAPAGDGGAAYALASTGEGWWVARGASGLEAPDGPRLGRAAGLPSSTVWAVATGPDGVWVGTRRGLARIRPAPDGTRPPQVTVAPVAAWPADRDTTALLVRRRGMWVAGPGGVTRLGRPHRDADDLVVAAPQPVVALLDDERGGAWAIGSAAVHLDRRGDLSVVELPAAAAAAARGPGGLWLAMAERLWWLPDGARRPVAVRPLTGVTALVADGTDLWAVADRRVVRVAPGAERPFLRTRPVLSLAIDPADPGRVFVGTEDGLEGLVVAGPDEGEVIDLLADRDRGVAVPAVAADGRGGAWFATVAGTVGRLDADGTVRLATLPGPDPPPPRGLVVDEDGDGAWLLSERGLWRVRLPARSDRSVSAPGGVPGAGP
ncbi:MAG: hypothetical protein D6798_08185 [Deltaproteobacteria bacterium]|nr:MAG: hypothetical protein D6798_08185 [Deltaproteobacteria bacterium]